MSDLIPYVYRPVSGDVDGIEIEVVDRFGDALFINTRHATTDEIDLYTDVQGHQLSRIAINKEAARELIVSLNRFVERV